MSAYYVEVSEHDTKVDFVPFLGTARQPRIPGRMNVARLYGPFTERGAERVARRALAQVGDDVETFSGSGNRYTHDAFGTRMVRVHTTTNRFHLPFGWSSAIRNMPKDA